uniref:Uncharacterized protein n=1 Tax=Candidatus Kentrum eta TaxID=2126337 RepID=A0A450VK84_9GAMM|nr:MAG: hypothetical protein BECKH772B_GA0070898_102064 [Candidatus Kentron sp. H]VFK01873.1 MAG: hypothetical protein BECKH772A_GA0070896_102454 [Candidatus Kentron sp. H]VFK05224.1 MAG: hypothetical protein BECKH772C_GA0070978_102484 [Candidatus Kentron sp. H]
MIRQTRQIARLAFRAACQTFRTTCQAFPATGQASGAIGFVFRMPKKAIQPTPLASRITCPVFPVVCQTRPEASQQTDIKRKIGTLSSFFREPEFTLTKIPQPHDHFLKELLSRPETAGTLLR